MSSLRDRLALTDSSAQARLARDLASTASTDDLIDVLLWLRLDAWAEHHVLQALTGRGRSVLGPATRALLAAPLAPETRALGEALVRILDNDTSVRQQVVSTLCRTAEAILDTGATTRGIASHILLLRDCAAIVGPLPELAPLARRLVALSAEEDDPYPLADYLARQWLDWT